MKEQYQLVAEIPGTPRMVRRLSDGAFIPMDEANRDYQQYLADTAEQKPAPKGGKKT